WPSSSSSSGNRGPERELRDGWRVAWRMKSHNPELTLGATSKRPRFDARLPLRGVERSARDQRITTQHGGAVSPPPLWPIPRLGGPRRPVLRLLENPVPTLEFQ